MACGDCNDPRNLCRCAIEAADSSVTITGDGSDGFPYAISAPGAGAGTRGFDRASIYQPYAFPLPPEYTRFDFYGAVDPATLYAPNEFDGWYQTESNAAIGVRGTPVAAELASGTSISVTIPTGIRDGDVAIVVVSSAATGPPGRPADWSTLVTAVSGPLSAGAYAKVLKASDALTTHQFTGLAAPIGGYLQVFYGVDQVVLDAAGVSASTGGSASTGLNVGPVTTVTADALLLSAATIDSASATLVAPAGMSTVNLSHGTAYASKVTSQLQAGAAPSGPRTWTHTPVPPNQRYVALLFALRPGVMVNYFLWVEGRWLPVVGVEDNTVPASTGYATTIGDGTHSTFTVTHPLGLDCLVECVNVTTGQTCWPVVRRTGSGTVYLDFGDTTPAPLSRRVLITKVG